MSYRRLRRAIFLFLEGDWRETGPGEIEVHGYTVTETFCTCPAFQFSPDGDCKHRILFDLLKNTS